MKKRTVKLIAGSLCFILFWASVIVIIQKLLVPKYQTGVVEGSMVEEYYENPFGHDVIMVGDCEVYESVSTVELYRKYGIQYAMLCHALFHIVSKTIWLVAL